MKKFIYLFMLCCLFLTACSENKKESDKKFVEQTVLMPKNFELYPTTNMWTFLKLDTRNGKIWQVQYDINGNNRFEVPLNNVSLVSGNQQAYEGRFGLTPTNNIYTFILLDCNDGRTWQVQWSIEEANRMVMPISRN